MGETWQMGESRLQANFKEGSTRITLRLHPRSPPISLSPAWVSWWPQVFLLVGEGELLSPVAGPFTAKGALLLVSLAPRRTPRRIDGQRLGKKKILHLLPEGRAPACA